jgi:hypothetical protein
VLRRLFLGLLVPAVVGSCGGGGDGAGNPPLLPVSTQANLTTANAPAFANSVGVAARMAATMRLGQPLTLTATPGTLTDGGCFAIGAGQATVMVTPSTGSVGGTTNYSNFDHCFGMRLTGTANVSGTLNSPQINTLNFSFTNLSFAAGAQTYQLSGSASLQWIPAPFGGANYVMTLNGTVSGAGSFQLDNFAVNSTISAGLEDLLISGRLTMTDGFVDIAPTTTHPQLAVPSSGLQNGSVQMTGATTIATVFFNGAAAPSISIAPR